MSAHATEPDKTQHERTSIPAGGQPEDGAEKVEKPDENVVGASKLDPKAWQEYIGMVENDLQQETNETRRHNAQVCLDFVRKHGVPAKGYTFTVHHGVVEVLTNDESLHKDYASLRKIHPLSEAYGLAAPREARPTELE
ncbi:hypothetical protein J7T55_002476 [Diaporthe amygdali]|uniref:uncharacterized protein n=1 Tax=Phomopsis amygdali TaxID=1214568 RepID=UPI0022FE896A|nr:uncharacterized protein J7T55_002476 [Diaporthe amygdali]KAJ0121965.1 hypothetical protein J7T55_002476 [Diaporthe amygdali]